MRQYLSLLEEIKEKGLGHNDRTGVGTQSHFGAQRRFDLSEGLPIMTTKKVGFRWIAEELFWFISGSTDVRALQQRGGVKPITIWDDWATEAQCARFGRPAGQLGPVYGHTWRNFGASTTYNPEHSFETRKLHANPGWYSDEKQRWVNWGYKNDGFDQLKAVVDMISDSKQRLSRRLIVTGWHPVEATEVALPPCHTLFQFKYHQEENRLDLQLYQRSCDVFLGVPYNITSYALLLSLVAHCCDMNAGHFIHTFGDVHIYDNHRDQVDMQLAREPKTLPTLQIHESLRGTGWGGVLRCEASDLTLLDYDPAPSIAAEVAV